MILNFRPTDMNTFRATFNLHVLTIHKQANNSWRLFVNDRPCKNGIHDTARRCMEMAERTAEIVLKKRLKKGN